MDRVAAHPLTPPFVLERLAADALGAGDSRVPGRAGAVRRALVRNAHVPVAVRARLLGAAAQEYGPVAFTPGTTVDEALALLDGVRLVVPWTAALRVVPDPQRVLLRTAAAARPDSVVVAGYVVRDRQAPFALRQDAAALLVAQPRFTAPDWREVELFVRQTLVSRWDTGAGLVGVLGAAAYSPQTRTDLNMMVTTGRRGPAPGTPKWFTDPGTSITDVIEHARGIGRVPAWTGALRNRVDATGQLAAAAMAACPTSRWVHERVVRTVELAAPVRQLAADVLIERGSWHWLDQRDSATLFETCTAAFVDAFLASGQGTYSHWVTIASRPDVSATQLARMDDLRAQADLLPVPTRFGSPTYLPGSPRQGWELLVASAPGCPPERRKLAASRLRALGVPGEVCDAIEGADMHDEAAFTAAGSRMPASVRASNLRGVPLVDRLVDAGVGAGVRRLRTDEELVTLQSLDVGFAGTIGELFDTAITISEMTGR